jgi:hypothetical protein
MQVKRLLHGAGTFTTTLIEGGRSSAVDRSEKKGDWIGLIVASVTESGPYLEARVRVFNGKEGS